MVCILVSSHCHHPAAVLRLVRKASFSLRKQMAKPNVSGSGKGQAVDDEGLQIDIDYYMNAVSTIDKLALVNKDVFRIMFYHQYINSRLVNVMWSFCVVYDDVMVVCCGGLCRVN